MQTSFTPPFLLTQLLHSSSHLLNSSSHQEARAMYASFSRGSSHMMNPTFDCTSSLIRSPSSNRSSFLNSNWERLIHLQETLQHHFWGGSIQWRFSRAFQGSQGFDSNIDLRLEWLCLLCVSCLCGLREKHCVHVVLCIFFKHGFYFWIDNSRIVKFCFHDSRLYIPKSCINN